jgi:hypothetical protein
MQVFAVKTCTAPGNVPGGLRDYIGEGDIEAVREDCADEFGEGETEGTGYYYGGDGDCVDVIGAYVRDK